MALAPTRTLIVATPGTKMFSDIAGRHLVYLNNTPESRKRIVSRLQTMGLAVDDSGDGWLERGRLRHVAIRPQLRVEAPGRT